ncbi:uncharacterized protein [Montipora foliosa]|uniref:uncharacterized protein n=1 Tax=Montipora foliosa TaxID=591990 RepID=UPI0035F10A1D
MRLLEFVLNHNYFKHNNIHYKQIFGCAMGSPISPVIADLVMEEIEETAIATAPHPPKWWFRYVDDSHTCLRKKVDGFYQHLNSMNPHLQFTLELEDTKGQGLPFLDTITTRRGTQLEVNVYKKPIHTDRYLDFNSHHPMCHHKRSVLTCYSGHRTYHQHRRGKAKKGSETTIIPHPSSIAAKDRCRNFLPYVQGISERISWILRQHQIKVAFKPL